MSLIVDTLGWMGAAMLILAYGLISWERVSAQSKLYQWLNIAGSALILLNSVYFRALPSAATNLFWIAVGLSVVARTQTNSGRVLQRLKSMDH